jgi:uncharacterized protein YjiS (DUF1127 family)
MSTFTPRMRAAFHAFRDYRVRRSAVWTLAAMDDVLLKDIGIGRSEIDSAVQGPTRHRD